MCQDGPMDSQKQRSARRTEALTKDVIIQTAVAILDRGGEDALSIRALAARLSTGSGALYNHVANKGELLSAATDNVMTAVIGTSRPGKPEEEIRALMLSVFDAINAHPWVGAQLAAAPWQPAVLLILDRIGQMLDALRVPERAQFDAASALVHHILGVAGQYAAGARLSGPDADRTAFLKAVATRWTTDSDSDEYPFLTRVATTLSQHDDREQFRAGVELILTGIAALS